MKKDILRRDFIKILSGTTTFGLAYRYGLFPHLISGPVRDALALENDDISLRPPEEKWETSICQQCQGGCGILVRVYGDRAVKIDGNPLHPINRGRLCARGQSGLQYLYDPDRIKGPMAREGARGEGKWKPISWDQALAELGDKLKTLRNQGKSHALAMLTGPQRGLAKNVSDRFMEAYGSPNLIRNQSDRPSGKTPAFHLMQGSDAGITYDIEDTNYILSFNSGLLEDHWSSVQLSRAYGKFRRGNKDERGKLVHIEPRLSVTGAKADQWVPINPGTEGVLAMGIASVIIIERRYDEEFIDERTLGFEDWTDEKGASHPGFKTLVIQEYPLEKVAKVTGVPRDMIMSLAREFVHHQPGVAIGNDGEWIGNQGIYNRMAIHALNGLVGNIQKKGGILSNARLPEIPLPPFSPDPVSAKGRSMPRIDGAGRSRYSLVQDAPENLAEQILKKQPYPIEILLIHGANPVYESPEPDRLVSALNQIPTVVSFSSSMDETTRYADIILPDSIYLEKWQLDTSYTLKGNPLVSVAKPVVAPTYDTRDTSEILIALAGVMGKPVSSAFPSAKSEDLVKASLHPLHASASGEAFGAQLEELWTKLLEQSGWKVRSQEPFDKFLADVQERGGWWDPVYYPWEWERALSTPSGKFEFYSLTARKYFSDLKGMDKDLALQKIPSPVGMDKLDAACLPLADPGVSKENDTLYNLELNPYVIPILSGLNQTNQPWLQDISGFHVYQEWHTWVEVNPETADKIGIQNGDWVWVESPKGKIKAQTRLFKGAMPDVINLPVGLGHASGGRWTTGIGENVLKILLAEKEPFSGKVHFQRSRARLTKTNA
ncbi:MAG: molybdopterin-dependent oxidoreductase [bacterium]